MSKRPMLGIEPPRRWKTLLGVAAAGLAGLTLSSCGSASRAGPAESGAATAELGRSLYQANCVSCHQSDGSGVPPAFPALRDNDRLRNVSEVVRVIHLGSGAMMAFSDLSADQVAAVATYIRDSWGNSFGAVTSQEVAAAMQEAGAVATPTSSVLHGVYSAGQAQRGQRIYLGACAACHGSRLNGAPDNPDMPGSPPIGGGRFLRNWSGQSLATLYAFTRTTMPPTNPGFLNDEQLTDVLAYMLSVSDMPAGAEELVPDPDVLRNIVIEEHPGSD